MTNHGDQVKGSSLYFMRVDDEGKCTDAGDPYCTVCSRMALQVGIKDFVLWNGEANSFTTREYNKKSYSYYL